jgi:non-ribosomal peptide synthetase component E (peptide arylation enzyme)
MLTQEINELTSEKALPNLQYILIAGEPLYGNDINRWRQASGNSAELVNLYGPSETTLVKLFYRIKDKNFAPAEIVPIGKPMPDTEVLIIEKGKLCPVSETGEIYIKTSFQSKGYYGDPKLNENFFAQNPLVKDRKDIVYKTGDLGQLLPDGDVRFVGRLDGQIKLHGKRVEIDEIEVILRQHPQVQEAAIAAKQDAFENMRLVGYVLPKPGKKPTVESLRRLLGDKLPDYMVPALFVILKALPLTHNGKIDRRSLPEPDYLRPQMEQPYVPPSTATQECVSGIWCNVLALDRAGVYDNFFVLGGNSLLATQIISRINKVFRLDFPLLSFFENPTVAGLSEKIEKLKIEGKAFQVVPIRALSRESHRMKGSV